MQTVHVNQCRRDDKKSMHNGNAYFVVVFVQLKATKQKIGIVIKWWTVKTDRPIDLISKNPFEIGSSSVHLVHYYPKKDIMAIDRYRGKWTVMLECLYFVHNDLDMFFFVA